MPELTLPQKQTRRARFFLPSQFGGIEFVLPLSMPCCHVTLSPFPGSRLCHDLWPTWLIRSQGLDLFDLIRGLPCSGYSCFHVELSDIGHTMVKMKGQRLSLHHECPTKLPSRSLIVPFFFVTFPSVSVHLILHTLIVAWRAFVTSLQSPWRT